MERTITRVAAALVDLLKQLEASSADLLPKTYSPLRTRSHTFTGEDYLRFGAATQSRRCRTYSTAAVDRFSQRLAGRYAAELLPISKNQLVV